ncbi:hypothetical protein L0P88_04460 [Muricauda sp. SCSIO 64092]|uniref:hypothetical protein n=1 Tax=Allomuricauda sp. SCSIO 64092 TaxID=2908842 RepID=UPI001FF46C53|nr:hypothetical protein [Muricauda sp. SCSIO 64092]UOY07807.1 hypothetical protein L0P88_04460 [Muricauda sp. SCSIO 64092]
MKSLTPEKKCLLLLGLAFVLTRTCIINKHALQSDIEYYATIGYQSLTAKEKGLTIYDITSLEYPPLAVAFLYTPNYLIWDTSLPFTSYLDLYIKSYRGILCFIDFANFTFLLLIIRRLYLNENTYISYLFLGGILYLLSTVIFIDLIYDRLDMVLLFLITVCFYFQIQGRLLLSAFFLSIGICFKLIPLLLLPIWTLGWLSNFDCRIIDFKCFKQYTFVLKSLWYLIIFSLGILGSCYWVYGSYAFSFLGYHGNRGIQIESLYSTIIQLIGLFGLSYELETSFGSQNVVSIVSPFISKLSFFIIFFGCMGVFFKIFQFLSNKRVKSSSCIASTKPVIIGTGYLLTLLFFLIGSKVLSTQYFLLPISFIAILFPNKHYGIGLLWLFILLLSIIIFPYLYDSDIISKSAIKLGKPSLLGTLLLSSRNGMLVYLFYLLYSQMDTPKSNEPPLVSLLFPFWENKEVYRSFLLILVVSSLLLLVNFFD